jgi:hypothetical protein
MKKIVIGFIIGAITFSGIGVLAANYLAKDIKYKDTNVEAALNDLYNKSNNNLENVYWDFSYTGEEQKYTIQISGKYKLETWGAQGGSYNSTYYGGYGAYSVGVVELKKGDTLFINVGGKGTSKNTSGNNNGGYNGGGESYTHKSGSTKSSGSGGGATHIATKTGLLSGLSSDKDKILIVSSGGGGIYYYYYNSNDWEYSSGGSGGGFIGNEVENYSSNYSTNKSQGGTYTSGGVGGDGYSTYTSDGHKKGTTGTFGQGGTIGQNAGGGSGGGSGFYGGGGGSHIAGGGGSSYIESDKLISSNGITKHMTCYNCTESNETATKTISNECHNEKPTVDCSKEGNGYAKITYLGN